MTMDPHVNFAVSLVATAPSPANSGTSLVVTAGEGTRFPDPASVGPYNIVIHPPAELPTPVNAEVCRVTAKSTDTLTITRAQESSVARSVLVGDLVYAAITAKTLQDAERLFPIPDVDTGLWAMPGWGWGSGATSAMPTGFVLYTPIFCSRPMSFDRIGVQCVVGVAGTARLGIYHATFNTTQNKISVGSLLVDAGTVDVTASGSKEATISQTLHGWYFLAYVADCNAQMQVPDVAAAVHSPVQWMNNDLNGTFDHCIPIVGSQSALVAGGLPSTPVAATSTATAARAPVRLRLT